MAEQWSIDGTERLRVTFDSTHFTMDGAWLAGTGRDDYEELYVNDAKAPDYEIDPDATEDFTFNLAGNLDGDTISSVEFVLPDGLTEVDSSNTTTTATIWVSDAECGRIYRITCRYTTAGGRTRDKTIRVIGREQ